MPQGMGMRPMRPSSKITTKQWVQQSVDDKEKGGPRNGRVVVFPSMPMMTTYHHSIILTPKVW